MNRPKFSEFFPHKLPRLVSVIVNGKEGKAVENNYFIAVFDEEVVRHVYNKEKYFGMNVIEGILRSPKTSDHTKVETLKALFDEIGKFEDEIYKLCEEAEEWNKKIENN